MEFYPPPPGIQPVCAHGLKEGPVVQTARFLDFRFRIFRVFFTSQQDPTRPPPPAPGDVKQVSARESSLLAA